jgi:penicillin-binding protein 1B
MALKIRFAMPKGKHPVPTLVLLIALGTFAVCGFLFLIFSGYYYFKYQGIVDARLKEPLFANTAKIFAAHPQCPGI